MTPTVLLTIAVTGLTIAFMHASIPTHWLPFVLTSRALRWSRAKTLSITAIAGVGHVLCTSALGILVAWLGLSLSDRMGVWFPRLAGGALLLFGLFYIYRQVSGGRGHFHLIGGHSHDIGSEKGPHGGFLIEDHGNRLEISLVAEATGLSRLRIQASSRTGTLLPAPDPSHVQVALGLTDGTTTPLGLRARAAFLESVEPVERSAAFTAVIRVGHADHWHTHTLAFDASQATPDAPTTADPTTARSDWAAIGSLFMLLTFSPCEGFIPVYISGVKYGWGGFMLLTAILGIGTVAAMILFTWLALVGMERVKIAALERFESGILGTLLCLLGLFVIFFET